MRLRIEHVVANEPVARDPRTHTTFRKPRAGELRAAERNIPPQRRGGGHELERRPGWIEPVPRAIEKRLRRVRVRAAAGRLDPDTAVTGPDGRAVAQWVLGSEPGLHEVEARLVVSEPAPPPMAVFQASAVAGEPDTVRAASPVSQPGRIGQPTPEDPTVLVLDRFGNPVASAEVGWEVTAGGGSVSSPQTATGTDGKATVTWTLGLGIGVQKLTARVDGAHGSPVTFTATVLF